jgi:hypothetical protein
MGGSRTVTPDCANQDLTKRHWIDGGYMKHYLILAALLLAAFCLEIAGMATGAVVLMCAGVMLELCFWFNLFQKRRQRSHVI